VTCFATQAGSRRKPREIPAIETEEVRFRGRFDHGAAVNVDRRLGEQPAITGGARLQPDQGLGQHNALKVRGRSEIHTATHLPKDIFGKRAANQ